MEPQRKEPKLSEATEEEAKLYLALFFTGLFGIISIICFGVGYGSLNNWKNTGTVGTILSQSVSSFNTCWANVSFVPPHGDAVQAFVSIPCTSTQDDTGLPIPLCFNRGNPQNVAYDPVYKSDASYSNPCSSIGYNEAFNDVVVGYVCLVLWLLGVTLIWWKSKCEDNGRIGLEMAYNPVNTATDV